MAEQGTGVVVVVADRPRDAFEDPDCGDATRFMLFSVDIRRPSA